MATQPTVEELARRVADGPRGEFRSRLREELLRQPVEWLADELLARLPDDPSVPGPRPSREPRPAESDEDRSGRLHRIRSWQLDHAALDERVTRLTSWTRDRLEAEGLLRTPPPKGGPLIAPSHRSPAGEDLLREAKDLLYALLFGEPADGVVLDRVARELLTLTLPRDKAHTVAFMLRAATEIGAVGTWQDPAGRANDERAPNLLFQIEYGEVAGELVGRGITACLRLVNDLEVNEQVLYGRMENVEESTLA
ncbi:hypothetical protein ABZ313_06840 [Streptomyces sp. NPDC006251]|uniref:hypothetical protein n=2 Tax=unclassified Streptomyces TaxID=2593676 RepID=UPI0033A36995